MSEGDRARAAQLGAAIGYDFEAAKFAASSVVIAGTPSDIAQALQEVLPDIAPNDLVDILNEEAENAPQAEAVALHPYLTDLRARGLKLGVCTNDGEAPARAHLAAARVTELFDFIAGFDSGHGAKPAPGPLLAFAKSQGLAPEHVAMVGDSLHDLKAGRAAGMQTIGVLTGMAGEADLAPFADVVFPDIGHIPAWLEG